MLENNPERLIIEPGDSEKKQQNIDDFFGGVVDTLGYDEQALSAFCEIRSRGIARIGSENTAENQTDDRVTEFVARGLTVALAVEIRDDFNYIQLLLTNFLNPELLERLQL